MKKTSAVIHIHVRRDGSIHVVLLIQPFGPTDSAHVPSEVEVLAERMLCVARAAGVVVDCDAEWWGR